MLVIYPARTSLLEDERTYRLAPPTLTIERPPAGPAQPPRVPEIVLLKDVVQVHLRYFPTRAQRNRFECLVHFRARAPLKITNQRYRGVMNFEDRSGDYRRFVQTLCAHVATENPAARFRRGRHGTLLVLEWGFLGATLTALWAVLWMIGGLPRGLALLKLVLLAFYLPTLARYARRSWPGSFDPRAVPETVLPEAPRPAPNRSAETET